MLAAAEPLKMSVVGVERLIAVRVGRRNACGCVDPHQIVLVVGAGSIGTGLWIGVGSGVYVSSIGVVVRGRSGRRGQRGTA